MPAKRMRGKQPAMKPPPRQTAASEPQISGASDTETFSSTDQAFLQELAWCLERLESRMKQQNAPPRQVEEATKAWKTLSNPRTAHVKKRQVMRMMFGDYRATMEQEERQYSIRPQGMTITNATTSKTPKSKYFKSSAHVVPNVLQDTTRDFQFGFSISQDSTPSTSGTGCVDNGGVTADSKGLSATEISQNYYLMGQSSSGSRPFNFNFSVDDTTTS